MADGHSDLGLAFAFLAGAFVGAGIALLLAPQPGGETRAQVTEWMKQAQEKARRIASGPGDDGAAEAGGEASNPAPAGFGS